ncbi:MAG TPA: hypothetical protein VN213_16885 [Solirubrobacteraceae bacterium]|nr:hypothetical protein [Solirubrobacteraceae bacterium]
MTPDLTRVIRKDELREVWDSARRYAGAAYDAWCAAEVADRRDAFAVFVAAADQEAAAERAFLRGREVSPGPAAP